MTTDLELGLYIFILAGFLGYHIISRIPPLLHTPLMSATNALSGIAVIGSLVIAGAGQGLVHTVLGFLAVVCSTTNVVGGFLITDRILRMFHSDRAAEDSWWWLGRLDWILFITIVLGAALASAALAGYGPGISSQDWLRSLYLLSAVLFILGMMGLSSPRSARRGMIVAAVGMGAAVMGTLFHPDITKEGFVWIGAGLALGSMVGAAIGLWVPMTAVPQRTALSHAMGALAATLVGISEYVRHGPAMTKITMAPLGLEVMIGALTFTGSLVAAAKLQGLVTEGAVTYRGQNVSNLTLLALMLGLAGFLVVHPGSSLVFTLLLVASLLFGLLFVIPIGAADMPVVISLLNSYAGLADAAMGFVLMNKVQIITGSLDGSSGFMLSLLMCRAMNRSAFNVIFGAFGKPSTAAPREGAPQGTVRSITVDELAVLLEGVRSVVIAPGYGMAVAQAQHALADVGKLLASRGADVKYAIHPVAGRMPGHMNVLMAEANVPYDQLFEMEQINSILPSTEVVLVVGANDVTNPAAKHDRRSPLYGMPILEVDRARSIVVLKRSMSPGFAGVDNELYVDPKCMMFFGDARDSLTKLLGAMKA